MRTVCCQRFVGGWARLGQHCPCRCRAPPARARMRCMRSQTTGLSHLGLAGTIARTPVPSRTRWRMGPCATSAAARPAEQALGFQYAHARPRQRALPCVIIRSAHAGGRPRRFAQLFNVNGDSAAALDVSVHYPMLQLIVFFDWLKPEDVANGTARARARFIPLARLGVEPGRRGGRPRLWACAGGRGGRQLGLQGFGDPTLRALPCKGCALPCDHRSWGCRAPVALACWVQAGLQAACAARAAGGLARPVGPAGRGGRVRPLCRAGQRRLRRAALLAAGGRGVAGVAFLPRAAEPSRLGAHAPKPSRQCLDLRQRPFMIVLA